MIQTLIVMTTYGSIFYSKETFFDYEGSGSDISLTAGLISAVYNLTQETQQQKIEELDLEDSKSIFKELPGEKLFIITGQPQNTVFRQDIIIEFKMPHIS